MEKIPIWMGDIENRIGLLRGLVLDKWDGYKVICVFWLSYDKCLSIHLFEFVFSLFGFGDGSGRTPQQIWLHDLTIYELRTIKDNK